VAVTTLDDYLDPTRALPSECSYFEWQARRSPSESIACVWVSRPNEVTDNRVLPDACIDIIWDGADLFVAGPDTRPAAIVPSPGLAFAGVRFRPGKASGFLGLPASEMLDSRVALAELWGQAAAGRLADQLASAPSAEAAAHLLDAAVADRAGTAPSSDPIVDALVALMRSRVISRATVRATSELLSVGERRLYRRCCAAVGYGPKTLERVLRFQRAIGLAPHTASLALLAARAGYADQAHLSRECQRLAGTTPSDLFKTGVQAAS
jgi:AraC-like DNA-binding protein